MDYSSVESCVLLVHCVCKILRILERSAVCQILVVFRTVPSVVRRLRTTLRQKLFFNLLLSAMFQTIVSHGSRIFAAAFAPKKKTTLFSIDSSSKDQMIFKRATQVPLDGELREPIIFQGDIGGVGSTVEVINFIISARLTGQLTCVQGEVRK